MRESIDRGYAVGGVSAVLIVVSVLSAALTFAAAPAAAVGSVAPHQRPVMRPPVDTPVSDPFRMPENPYGPGNRGIEYDTEPGQLVRAAAAGVVRFAGAVAGSLHVTVDHGAGLRSSYSHLRRIAVRAGASVVRGAPLGIAGERLHFGVRLDDEYRDPGDYIGVRRVRVRLVPH
ncbi:MAG: M23 family metallopeptidase [Acidimicrobiaceae bacterium]|nr:M23 family metallopeptidase [Acidimicrobiaceae bacterium]MCY4280808.1 M23 family metallopeptidase [Acidimicrobiaceae bacterium]MCY4295004.1 M23 family metallopeptidase [Acidimicrobiaceae bacterium]